MALVLPVQTGSPPLCSLVSGTTRRAGDHHRAHHPMAGIIFMAGEWGVQFTRSITQVARRNPAFCPDRCLMRWENLSRG